MLTPDYEGHITIDKNILKVDDADVKRADTEDKVAQHEMNVETKKLKLRKKIGFTEIIVGIIWFVGTFIVASFDHDKVPDVFAYLAIFGVVCSPLLVLQELEHLLASMLI